MLETAFEISSMGIRVDADAMEKQLAASGNLDRREHSFHKAVLADELLTQLEVESVRAGYACIS